MPAHSFKYEVDMYGPLIDSISSLGSLVAEVPIFDKRIDLVYSSYLHDELHAVEVKRTNWMATFKQAVINQLAVKYCYIALPYRAAKHASNKGYSNFTSSGIGLIGVKESGATLLISPRCSEHTKKHYLKSISETLDRTQDDVPSDLRDIKDDIRLQRKALIVIYNGAINGRLFCGPIKCIEQNK